VAREVERHTSGTVQPYQGVDPSELLPYVPNSVTYDRPDWTELRPPANTRTQEFWAKVIQPYRAILLFQLWLTYAWWRPVIAMLIIATLAVLTWIVIGLN